MFWDVFLVLRISQLCDLRRVDVDGEGRIVVCEEGNERVSMFEKMELFFFRSKEVSL